MISIDAALAAVLVALINMLGSVLLAWIKAHYKVNGQSRNGGKSNGGTVPVSSRGSTL